MKPNTVNRDLKRIGIATTVFATAYGITALLPVIPL
jgi:hypothetical protein